MKTFDIKDVFSWSNAEDAKAYLGKECYFADSIFTLQDNINNNKVYILEKVANNDKTDVTSLFIFFGPVSEFRWGLCLPADKVKKVEEPKKYRPFKDLNEFAKTLNLAKILGSEIIYFVKTTGISGSAIITRESTYKTKSVITLGGGALSMEDLFDSYEWLDKNGVWKPFGVLDES